MLKTFRTGLTLTLTSLMFVGCAKEEAMTSSQVEYTDVNISFFDATIEQIATPSTRGEGDESLSNFFKRLDVALIPEVKNTDETYTTSQTSSDESFGKVSMRVPTGNYTLVGIANGRDQQANINSAENVTFQGALIGDVGYIVQPITVKTSNPTATACGLKRAVALFRIKCMDELPEDAKSVVIKMDKNVAFTFNPTTGYCSSTNTTFTYSVNKLAGEDKTNREFDVYTFLTDEKITTNVTVIIKNGESKVLNTMQFDNVTLQRNHVTTYKGNLFTAGTSMDFTFTDGEITSSGFDKEF